MEKIMVNGFYFSRGFSSFSLSIFFPSASLLFFFSFNEEDFFCEKKGLAFFS